MKATRQEMHMSFLGTRKEWEHIKQEAGQAQGYVWHETCRAREYVGDEAREAREHVVHKEISWHIVELLWRLTDAYTDTQTSVTVNIDSLK